MTERRRLYKKLDSLMRERILERDKVCQKCGKAPQKLDCSHVYSKKTYPFLRFDEDNLKILCSYCHMQWHANPKAAGEWINEKFPERMARLEAKRIKGGKLGIVQLRELLEELKCG